MCCLKAKYDNGLLKRRYAPRIAIISGIWLDEAYLLPALDLVAITFSSSLAEVAGFLVKAMTRIVRGGQRGETLNSF